MADEAPPYNEVQGDLLDPQLVFHADMFRGLYLTRNIALAKEIVDFIARAAMQCDPPMLKNRTGKGYTYDEQGSLFWDELIGYPAYQAFTTSQIPKIINLAKHDLKKRGFDVYHLDLSEQNVSFKTKSCGKRGGIECHCQCHGIFVTWQLSCG
jgi:hypothetical protein